MGTFREMSYTELAETLQKLEGEGHLTKPVADAQRLLHELRVHQIELEMQNRDLREAQQQLEESRSRYADLFDFAPIGYCTLDANGRVLEANFAVAAMFRAARGEMIGKPFTAMVSVEDVRAFRAHLKICFTEKVRVTTEISFLPKGRGRIVVQMVSSPTLGPDGEVIACRTTLTNVSALKYSEAILRYLADASEVLSSSMDHTATLPAVVRLSVPIIADIAFLDVLDDRNHLRRIEIAIADPRKRALADVIRDDAVDPTSRDLLAQVLRTGKARVVSDVSSAMTAALPPRLAIHARSAMFVPLTARGHALGVLTLVMAESGRYYSPRELGVAQDIARRAAMSLDNAQLYASAQQAIRARDDILAVVSHDLKDPLNRIMLAASAGESLLQGPGEDGSPAASASVGEPLPRGPGEDGSPAASVSAGEPLLQGPGDDGLPAASASAAPAAASSQSDVALMLAMIVRASKRMANLVDELLDVSSVQAGHFSIQKAPCQISELLSDVREAFVQSARDKDIALRVEGPESDATLFCDRDRIFRVLANVMGNAVKFTPAKGAVILRAEVRADEVRFTISDDGPGISPERLPHVFERFWQAEETARKGRGLGLYIAKGIVLAHGGRIWAESDGQGARFVVALPHGSSEVAVSRVRDRAQREPEIGDDAVLVVDDDRDTRDLLCKILGDEGYRVVRKADGQTALDYLREWGRRPCLVLLDVRMPTMDGWECLSELKRTAEFADIPVVCISSADSRAQASAMGVAFLEKPVRAEQLLEAVKQYEMRSSGVRYTAPS